MASAAADASGATGAAALTSRIVYSKAGVEIVTKPFLVGDELEALALSASKDFVGSLDLSTIENPISLEILNGGHYYFVKDAYEAVTGKPCRLATLRAKRRFDEESKEWKVRVWDKEGEPTEGTVLIGDTIATGTTLRGVLLHVVAAMEEAGKFHDVIVFAIAGSEACEPGLADVQAALAKHGRGLTVVYANAKFNLASNGTDLGFDGAEYNDKAKAEIDAAVGAFANQMKCAVWDWGDRFREINNHLAEIEEYFDGLGESVPAWMTTGIKERIAARTAEGGAAAE